MTRTIAESALPPLAPCNDLHLKKCLRVMLAVLPKRNLDDISGELFAAAYIRKLRDFSDEQISFMAEKSMERCKWFPTIAECIEIIGTWQRNDKFTERRHLAKVAFNREQRARQRDEHENWLIEQIQDKFWPALLTMESVAKLPKSVVEVGLKCGALGKMRDGTIAPMADALTDNPDIPRNQREKKNG